MSKNCPDSVVCLILQCVNSAAIIDTAECEVRLGSTNDTVESNSAVSMCLIFNRIDSRQTTIYRPVTQPRDQTPTHTNSSSSRV